MMVMMNNEMVIMVAVMILASVMIGEDGEDGLHLDALVVMLMIEMVKDDKSVLSARLLKTFATHLLISPSLGGRCHCDIIVLHSVSRSLIILRLMLLWLQTEAECWDLETWALGDLALV